MTKASKSKQPAQDLVQELASAILQGRHMEGDILPSDTDLARKFKVSRYAAREAYSELVRRRLVRRVKRKGTVVCYNPGVPLPLLKIGLLLISDVPSNFIFEKGVAAVVGDRGAGMRVYYHYNHEPACEKAVADALAHDVQGLIIAPPLMSSHEPFRRLMAKGFPIVLAFTADPEVPSVFPDDHKAGLLVGQEFGARGFVRPAVVTDDQPYARVRFYGFREGLAESGVRMDEKRIVPVYYATEKGELITDVGRLQVDAILNQQPRPDCIFAVNDAVAIAVYYWLLKRGVRVPEDIAIAGIDNLGPRFHPFQLTSVDIGLEQMGRAAAELMLQQMNGQRGASAQRCIEPKLVVSQSTKK